MHRLLRYYNQNRIKVWTIILVVIFIFVVIQVLNNIAKQQNIEEQKEETSLNNDVSYQNESKSIITEGKVAEEYQEDFGRIIDEFFTYCVNHQPEKAYELLAPETKKILYKSENQFENLYYKDKFEGNKQYSFQSWTRSSEDIYIYQVKIYDNMLLTGKRNDEYIEDYVTIVPIEDTYMLNINSYIGRKEINESSSNDILSIEAVTVDRYMNNEIYTFRVKNNIDREIMIDTRENTDTAFITDDKDNKYESFLYENSEEELILKPKESKLINIKFNDSYRSDINITSVNFTDIVDYEDYMQNKETKKYELKLNI